MLEKHSLNIAGHRSSITLEPEFWLAFKELARRRGLAINNLATAIDANRDASTNLSSAIRLAVLEDMHSRLNAK